ncbi:MAG: hypothetical protein NTZ49_05925 [Candidatus Parcubacteria bacterium]|nr:hypothetical protein [Candidatus Parcubacteria bacterium]
MIILLIAKFKPQIAYWLFFCLVIVALYGLLPNPLGLIVLICSFIWQSKLLGRYFEKRKILQTSILHILFLLAYYLISLTILYYFIGLTRLIFSIWFFITYLILFLLIKKLDFKISNFDLIINEYKKIKQSWLQILSLLGLIVIFFITYFQPILDGNPTPWSNFPSWAFVLFSLITFLLIADYYNRSSIITTTVYYLYAICLVAIKYKLSYGFDTLIHQASLNEIAAAGKILPLTPFYIGQYVFELLIHFFCNLDFTVIERFLIPVFFVTLTLLISKHFFSTLNLKINIFIVPIVSLFLIPDQFFYSTPYAFAIIWAIIFSCALYLYLIKKNKADFYLMVISATCTLLIHPFVGLPFIFIIIGAINHNRIRYKKINLFFTFISSSLIIFLGFAVFNLLSHNAVSFNNPLSYWSFLIEIFSPPVWFNSLNTSLGYLLIYTYERYFLLILALIIAAFFIAVAKKRFVELILIILSLSFIITGWLFISGISVSGYTYSDQLNYSYRLIQIARWLLWPIWLIIFYYLFTFINSLKFWTRIIYLLLISLLLCVNWYLTYPRNDKISHLSVNSIRAIDYRAVNFIYSLEKGKNGYLVLANQLFGAAAVKSYGFGPYYQTYWGNLLYYSIPMSSEYHTRYEKITSENEFDYNSILEIMKTTKINRVYLILTDYWQPEETTKEEIKLYSSQYWNLEDKIEIYQFNITP